MNPEENRESLGSTDTTAGSASSTHSKATKALKILLRLAIVLFVCAALGAWSSYDYSLRCMKCLAGKHTVEQRFFGITFFRRTSDGGPGAGYERIFGHPCQHVFRKGGFGRGSRLLFMPTLVGCGSTAEGILVRPRVEAVSATFAAERRLPDRALALETFRVIDKLLPPDTESNQLRELPKEARSAASSLGFYLSGVKTVEQWQAVLTAAHGGFKDVSNLPTD